MCSIGGVVLRPGVALDIRSVLERMLSIQHHRGPDGQGYWWDTKSSIGLCHNRLAILDLSENGRQPMQSSNGILTIVFNGEIYNWRELRRQLEAKGIRFHTGTDTEVLLEAYREFGTEVPQYLRGMFSFAVHDSRDGSLFCARDRVGKKPFVYAETSNGFAFASEIPAVLAMPGCDTTLNHAAVAGMLIHNVRHIPDPHTAYLGLKRLRPGHAMLVKEGKVERVWRYWNPQAASEPSTPKRLRELLEESVRLRMVADVPVGALLSGGVDSSSVVNLMQRFSGEPIRTYALGFDKDDEDLRRARVMAEKLGCIHKEFYFDPDRQLKVFRKILSTYGEPIMLLPLIHTYELCREIRDDGIKVVLAGHGADELFYGYTGHLRTALISAVLPWLFPLSPLVKLLPDKLCRGPLALVAAQDGCRKAAIYRNDEKVAWSRIINPDIKKELINIVAEELEYWGKLLPPGPYIDESNFVALMVENTHSVTIASDLPAMMASVEMRAPFLDQKIVSFALATHYRKKVTSFRDSSRLKHILKIAVDDLVPHDLLYAPKRGFGMGIQEKMVLQGPWKRYAEEVFASLNDLGGLFDRKSIRHLWEQHNTDNTVDSSFIARLFAIQMWANHLSE
ncbi:MAG: asparagine synthase (glutamine-hydrolyzing) [Nitrospirota bacterium]